MKILLTGILDSFVLDMLPQFLLSGHQVSLIGEWPTEKNLLPGGVTSYPFRPGDANTARIMEAIHFNAVLFFYSYQCEEAGEDARVKGAMLDALLAVQTAAQNTGTSSFVLVTDRRVFGARQQGLESETPIPDSAEGVLIKAAEDCFHHSTATSMSSLLVRVTSLYAPRWDGSLFAYAEQCARDGVALSFPGDASSPCDFLRAHDLAEFLELAIEGNLSGTAHLVYGEPYTYGDVASRLQERFPKLRIGFVDAERPLPMLQGKLAQTLDWVPRHNWANELDDVLKSLPRQTRAKGAISRSFGAVRQTFGKLLPYVELALFAALAYGLTMLTGRDALFRYFNFWLLYVVVMGNMHGIVPGVLSAVVACFFYGLDWVWQGNDLYLLFYNIDNWLPISTYLLGGGVFGYLRDKRVEQLRTLEREKRAQTRETEFLETIYKRTAEDRAQLEAQVTRSRDSYGRIYSITKELDSLQPEQIFLSTLNVMENILQNQSVAIYYYKPGYNFARLVLHSSGMERLANSLDASALPELQKTMDAGRVFANSGLLPGYPSFAAPIIRDDAPMAVIMLWDVPFDQCSLYFQNLFGITCGLVQSALIRALQYFQMSQDVYVEDTHFLTERPFLSALEVYRSMRRRHAGSFLLMRVYSEAQLSPEEYDRKIGAATRSTDLCARLNNGSYYVLLPQAEEDFFPRIAARFASQQLLCELVPQESDSLE